MILNENCQLVIFDLDGTLHTYKDMDSSNASLSSDILNMILFLKQKNIKIALASLNSEAAYYLKKYKILHFFDFVQYKNWTIKGNFKSDLFKEIHESSKIPYKNMVFFDDKLVYCEEAMDLEIKAVIVDQFKLITWEDLFLGLDYFTNSVAYQNKSSQTTSKFMKYKKRKFEMVN